MNDPVLSRLSQKVEFSLEQLRVCFELKSRFPEEKQIFNYMEF